MNFTFATPGALHIEEGSAGKLASILSVRGLDVSRTILITDPGVHQIGLAASAITDLKANGADVTVFCDVEADPPAPVIRQGADLAKTISATLVVGFGGGSVMDVAKLVAYLAGSDDNLDDIYGVGLANSRRLPLALVPTTAGTGSEVTMVSIVTVGTNEKKGVVAPALLPDLAVLDAELTVGLPPHVTAATGIDAMIHAIEAYTSVSANNNPLSKVLAREALTLLGANIEDAVFRGSRLETRANMLLGATLAGMAFCNSPVAAVHALAYPIGTQFHVPHGLSNALVLPHVMRFNATECREQYTLLAPLVFPDVDWGQINDPCEAFILRLAELASHIGLPRRLRDVSVTVHDVDKLALDAMNQTRLLVNNPKRVTLDDARAIYRAAM